VNRLEVAGLKKSYPPRRSLRTLFGGAAPPPRLALTGASLHVGDGEIVGLVGINGAGKTTLLKSVLGLVQPEEGTIHVSGVALREGDSWHRRQIGYVSPVERSFYLRLSCRENLLFFSRLYGGTPAESSARVDQALRSVHLSDRAGDRADALSSGMRQRLALARALLHSPTLVLLDEPTRSLDPVARGQIHELIVAGRAGRGVLIASHDLAEIESLCDRVVVLSEGSVTAEGNVAEIRRQLGLGEIYELTLDAPAAGVDLGPAGVEAEGSRLRLTIRGENDLAEAISRLVGAGRKIQKIERGDRPIEQAIRRGAST